MAGICMLLLVSFLFCLYVSIASIAKDLQVGNGGHSRKLRGALNPNSNNNNIIIIYDIYTG